MQSASAHQLVMNNPVLWAHRVYSGIPISSDALVFTLISMLILLMMLPSSAHSETIVDTKSTSVNELGTLSSPVLHMPIELKLTRDSKNKNKYIFTVTAPPVIVRRRAKEDGTLTKDIQAGLLLDLHWPGSLSVAVEDDIAYFVPNKTQLRYKKTDYYGSHKSYKKKSGDDVYGEKYTVGKKGTLLDKGKAVGEFILGELTFGVYDAVKTADELIGLPKRVWGLVTTEGGTFTSLSHLDRKDDTYKEYVVHHKANPVFANDAKYDFQTVVWNSLAYGWAPKGTIMAWTYELNYIFELKRSASGQPNLYIRAVIPYTTIWPDTCQKTPTLACADANLTATKMDYYYKGIELEWKVPLPDESLGPDLHISDFRILSGAPVEGKQVKARMVVHNGGTNATGPFKVEWWPGEGFYKPAGEWTVEDLKPGQSKAFTSTYAGYPSWFSRITTKVVADPEGKVQEENKQNNVLRKTIAVRKK